MKHLHLAIAVSALLGTATAALSQPAAGPPWPEQSYRVEWSEAHVPAEVAAGIRVAVPVAVRNDGDRVWPASQVFVSYHWFRDDRLIVWDGERTVLPRDLRAGSRAALSARVTTPSEPGAYVLKLTLVHELVTWFEHRGAAMHIQPVSVRPPAPLSSCGGSTPCAARQ
ncbi:MAG TPA: hypothetical protein VFN38_17525 [Gemmatimonadaceae bacterium]|nr:hypothetical protein [Gemmatimonadaceae bacterium]